jgi:AraC family transcriptional regulator
MRLHAGEYLGARVQECRLGPALLILSAYGPGQRQPWHVHANPGFLILLSGDYQDHWRHERHVQAALSVIYHPTTEPHAGQVGPRGMIGLNIELMRTWLDSLSLGESQLGTWRLLDSPWWRMRALRFLALVRAPDRDHEPGVETLAIELLEPVVRMSPAAAEAAAPRWLRRVEEHIRTDFRQPLSLKVLAGDAGVHPVYLARVFRRRHGCSVSEYIRLLRLGEAGRLILQHSRSLADAACEVGFYDQPHLARWFARQVGFAPRELKHIRDLLQARP